MKFSSLSNFVLLGLVFFVFLAASNVFAFSNSKTLERIFTDEWEERMEQFPSWAHSLGDKEKASRLADVSEKSQQSWLNFTSKILKRLGSVDFEKLSKSEKINFQMFKQQMLNRVNQLKFKDYQIPFLADSGFHTQIARIPTETEFKSLIDYKNYLKKLQMVPRFFQQNIDNMNAGLARNFSMPSIVMKGFTDVLKTHTTSSLEDSVFYSPFKTSDKLLSSEQQKQLVIDAKKIISEEVIPAYVNLVNYFENIYIPKTKKTLGAKQFPKGLAYYQHKIKQYTTGDLTPEAIHKIGLSEVSRIREEMNSIITKLEFQGSFKEFLTFLRTSEQFYAKTPDDLLKEASYIAKKMDGQLPKFFTKLPRQPYTVEAVPESIAPKYTTGRYLSAPLDSTRPGTYWVNTYALDKRPLYVLESLTLHEAVPGHHLQGSLTQELENLPNFRRYSYISAFGEGWALYCEKLGLEAGFYQDPYSDFGRLSYEMWRAARLVIDTGVHAFDWTREQAIELLEENSALSTHNIRTEVDRYISWPGQALSYKLGELKILALRQKAENKLGDDFDIRTFHDAVLANGTIPLNVLESQMSDFIQSQEKH